jgi:D-3-phosphoglycerate dehydrogenase
MTSIAITCIQLQRDLEQYRAPFEIRGWNLLTPEIAGQHLGGAQLVDALQGCAGVIAGDDRFTADVLGALDDLRVISKWGIGIDAIDLEAAAARGITVRNTPGVFDDEVADITMAYIVMVTRELAVIDRGVRTGSWPKPPGRSLGGKTLGVLGLGGIGRAVARRALVSGMNVIGVDPSAESSERARANGVSPCSVEHLWEASDVISVNCPLTSATHHLLDDSAFDRMRSGVFIVNTGRGSVISTTALCRALESGIVAGCALDVLEQEPLGAGHPLANYDNVVFGSHNASNTFEASARVHGVAISNLIEELENR